MRLYRKGQWDNSCTTEANTHWRLVTIFLFLQYYGVSLVWDGHSVEVPIASYVIRERNNIKRLAWACKYVGESSAGFRDVLLHPWNWRHRHFSCRKKGKPRYQQKYIYNYSPSQKKQNPHYMCIYIHVHVAYVVQSSIVTQYFHSSHYDNNFLHFVELGSTGIITYVHVHLYMLLCTSSSFM